MFDYFMDSQSVAYSLIKNSVCLDRISHAYLIDGNNCSDVDLFVKSLIKYFICPYYYSNFSSCNNCGICNRIDDNNYTEIRYIYSEGLQIKKEQLRELQDDFSLSNIEGNRRIYVIWNCEKMNVQASNSILKFLEEPVSNITAILVTSNVDSLLPTIVSRCQYIKLNNLNSSCDNTISNITRLMKSCNIEDDKINDKFIMDSVLHIFTFINYYEVNGVDTIIYLKKLWHDNFGDRRLCFFAFQLIIQLYYDILCYKLNGIISFYCDYHDKVLEIACNLGIDDLIKRLKIYTNFSELIKFNLNINLLMDDLIIELGE